MKKIKFSYSLLRRISQILFLCLFLFLFRNTDYSGSDSIPYAVNIFFRWDPLVALSVMLTAKKIIWLLFPALIVIVITMIFGRVFCGWFCPMGSLLDASGYLIKPVNKEKRINLSSLKYIILVIILFSSFFGLQLTGFFDPFSILVRSFTFVFDPAFYNITTSFFDMLYKHSPSWITFISEPVYTFLKSTVLPYKQSFFALTFSSFFIFFGIFALEKIENRFWCKNLCPLGGLLALFSRFTLLNRFPLKACKNCNSCADNCRMRAFDTSGYMLPEECNVCLDCVDFCPNHITGFKLKKTGKRKHSDQNTLKQQNSISTKKSVQRGKFNLSRRAFLGSAIAGVFLAFLSKAGIAKKLTTPYLIRPPGALNESEFLEKCVRCGECMKVCINNALHPSFIESGIEGVFSPVLIPRIGYCEFNCTLCGQVCPTGAIEKLTTDEKRKFVIGKAFFDKNRCIPFAKENLCMVCEEHCPVFDKAIKFKERVIKKDGMDYVLKEPYVVDNLCTGCGICENKCPVPGDSAIRIIKKGTNSETQNGYPSGGY